MRFNARAGDLADALTLTAFALDLRIKVEAANAVFITATMGEVRFVVNALDRAVAGTVSATVIKPGEAAVRAAAIASLVENFPEKDADITIETSGAVVAVTCGRSHYQLKTIPLLGLPTTLAIDEEIGRVELEWEQAIRVFAQPRFACDTGQTRPYLSGLFLFTNNDNTLVSVATDGHRLVKLSVPAAGVLSVNDRRLIVPLPSAKICNRLLARTKGGLVVRRCSRTLLELTAAGFTFVTKLIDGSFPKFECLIPPATSNTAVVDRRTFVLAVERLRAATDPRCVRPAVTMEWRQGAELRLQLLGSDAADDSVAAEISGAGCVVAGLNYVAEIIGEFAGASIKLDSADRNGPIRITDPADSSLLALQMPIIGRS